MNRSQDCILAEDFFPCYFPSFPSFPFHVNPMQHEAELAGRRNLPNLLVGRRPLKLHVLMSPHYKIPGNGRTEGRTDHFSAPSRGDDPCGFMAFPTAQHTTGRTFTPLLHGLAAPMVAYCSKLYTQKPRNNYMKHQLRIVAKERNHHDWDWIQT